MTALTVAHVFHRFGQDYRARYAERMPVSHLRAMRDIERCRTAALGGHLYACDHCGKQHLVLHSCRNRHCPTCQFLTTERWIDARQADLLPVPYFHVVFTIPKELHNIVRSHQRIAYDLLFQAASQTLLTLAADPKHLGAKIGFIAVLHTWTQTLMYHPHIHCIVTGGGLRNNDRWSPSRDDFFLPVRVMARLFRGKLLDGMRKSDLPRMEPEALKRLYTTDWVVYCKPPFGSPKHVLAYLGRYTHRIAISNARMMGIGDDQVRFRYRDPAGQSRSMRLRPDEFLRRFLTHVLPSGFVKIRYYGLLANRSRRDNLKRCRLLLLVKTPSPSQEPAGWKEILLERTGIDATKCPFCKQGTLLLIAIIEPPGERAPPTSLSA